MKVHVIHENPDWYAPLASAFDAAGVPHEEWRLGAGLLDLDDQPPSGVFWSRMSASSHTRGHPFAKDQTRGVLTWLECHGRRVVNGRRVLEFEMSKVEQLAALRAAGFDVPRTLAVTGSAGLLAAARKLPPPFISKHNQDGKGSSVRLFATHEEFGAYLSSPDYLAPVDGITLLQEYVRAADPFITRVEVVGGEFVYAITADTARGGFQLCPADACAVGQPGAANQRVTAGQPGAGQPVTTGQPGASEPVTTGQPVTAGQPGVAAGNSAVSHPGASSLFALRAGFDHPIVGQYLAFARKHGIEIAGFEFIETADGRIVTYDINSTTNYNAEIEAIAPQPALAQVALFFRRLLRQESARQGGQNR